MKNVSTIFEQVKKYINPMLLKDCDLSLISQPNNSYRIVLTLHNNVYRVLNDVLSVTLARVVVPIKSEPYFSFSDKHTKLLSDLGYKYYLAGSDKCPRLSLECLDLFNENNNNASKLFNSIIVNSVSFSTFGCCGRFIECSNNKLCQHDDFLYASVACAYKKSLDKGKIFYGANKNI